MPKRFRTELKLIAVRLAALGCGALVAFPSAAAGQDTSAVAGTVVGFGIDVSGVRLLRTTRVVPRGPSLNVGATGSITGHGDLRADYRPFGAGSSWFVRGRISNLQRNRFYGWGNRTDVSAAGPYHRLEQALGEVAFGMDRTIGSDLRVSAGPLFRWRFTDPELEAGPNAPQEETIVSALQPFGVGTFRQVGLTGTVDFQQSAPVAAGRIPTGVRMELGGTYFPGVADQPGAMVSSSFQVAASANVGLGTNLSVRAGLEKRWGRFPFMDAAFLGGRRSVRGFQKQRFAGDAAAWLTTDLHLPGVAIAVGRHDIRVGPLAAVDVGRVALHGQSAGGWHLGRGFGLWGIDGSSGRYVSALISWGDGVAAPRAYLNIGVPLFR